MDCAFLVYEDNYEDVDKLISAVKASVVKNKA